MIREIKNVNQQKPQINYYQKFMKNIKEYFVSISFKNT